MMMAKNDIEIKANFGLISGQTNKQHIQEIYSYALTNVLEIKKTGLKNRYPKHNKQKAHTIVQAGIRISSTLMKIKA